MSTPAAARHRGRPDVRPSGRALRIAFLGVSGLAGLALLTGDVWLLLLACLAVGALVVDALVPWPGACLHVGVTGPSRVRVGDTVPVSVIAANWGTRLSRPALVTLRSPLLDDVSFAVAALRPGERVEVRLTTQVNGRGHVDEVEVSVVKGGLLGLLSWPGATRRPWELHAAPGRADELTVDQRAGESLTEGGRPAVRPSGVEIQGLREWRPGDSSRHVHWRSTARRGRLVVTDRLEEVGCDLVVVLAAPAAQPGHPDPDWEELIARLAATALATSTAGGRVCLVAAIHGVPDLSTSSQAAVLDWCAELPPADAVLPVGDEAAAWERATRVLPDAPRQIVLRTPLAALRAGQR